jgi:hypothetical protein
MAETTLFHKLADGVRTIRAEILLPNDYGTPNNDDFYMVASYQDTSDIGRTQSSAPPPFGVAPLQAGSAVWTYTALYTDAGYTAWKLELITEHPVKQNTPVFVAVLMTKGRITSADELFVDPAIVIE